MFWITFLRTLFKYWQFLSVFKDFPKNAPCTPRTPHWSAFTTWKFSSDFFPSSIYTRKYFATAVNDIFPSSSLLFSFFSARISFHCCEDGSCGLQLVWVEMKKIFNEKIEKILEDFSSFFVCFLFYFWSWRIFHCFLGVLLGVWSGLRIQIQIYCLTISRITSKKYFLTHSAQKQPRMWLCRHKQHKNE